MKRYRNISLKNKIFFSILAVIMIISVIIALLARWILLSSLTSELEHRGVAIAQSVADRGSGFVLDDDRPSLTALIFDVSMLGERRNLVSYIYVDGPKHEVLAHTFIRPFPTELLGTNYLDYENVESFHVVQVEVDGEAALDIAVPVLEGIYPIATVHVGLNQRHIDNLVSKLRITFLGFIALVIVIIFVISHKIAAYITQPVTKLIEMSDEISKGNLNFKLDLGKQYVDILSDQESGERCPAYHNSDLPCWHVDKTMMPHDEEGEEPPKPAYCRECVIRHKQIGDEVLQLADSFTYMVRSIKLYRNRLNESEAKYRSLFDAGPDPIFVVARKSLGIMDVNPLAGEVYGYSVKELLGMSFRQLEAEEKMGSLVTFDELSRDGGSVFYPKAIHRKADGTTLFVNMHASATRYGGREAIIVSATDITEIVEKEAQLIQASKMTTLGEMSAGIAHELNQPLNAIKMGSDFLSMVVGDGMEMSPDQVAQVTEEMSNQVDRATEIINMLRQFGRMSDMTPEKININEPVRGVLDIIGHQLDLQRIDVDLDLDDALPPIQAHANRLQQVFFNLVSNARDAINIWSDPEDSSPRERQIRIRSYMDNGRVAIAFGDTGVGIDQSQVEKIFEPFYTTKETGKGMGLGLAISYGIVKDYGGEISVTSQIGAGTTFKLTFPRAV